MSIRNILIAGTIAIGASLSAGAASAAPVNGLELNVPVATESSLAEVKYGYGYGHRRLCRLPFFVLAKRFGFWRAKMIKRSCYRPYYHY